MNISIFSVGHPTAVMGRAQPRCRTTHGTRPWYQRSAGPASAFNDLMVGLVENITYDTIFTYLHMYIYIFVYATPIYTSLL